MNAPRQATLPGDLVLPCIQLLPAPGGTGQAHLSILSGKPFVAPGAPPAYLFIGSQEAELLLTIYRADPAMPPPELRITKIKNAAFAAGHEALEALPSEPLEVLVHVERTGDLRAPGGAWAGHTGTGAAIEGFAVTAQAAATAAELEYQAVLGQDWTTPWFEGGEFCGSRGLSLPVLGIRLRLKGSAAGRFTLLYWGRFAGLDAEIAAEDGGLCAHTSPLEALRVVIRANPEPASGPKKRGRRLGRG